MYEYYQYAFVVFLCAYLVKFDLKIQKVIKYFIFLKPVSFHKIIHNLNICFNSQVPIIWLHLHIRSK